MKEELSLTYAKQYFRRNRYKYCDDDAFESAILEYYLRKDEVEKLYKYILNQKGVYEPEITRRYERIIEEINNE